MPENTIRFCTLASGSSGNVVYCETAAGAVLIDAGISLKQLKLRMSHIGITGENIDGIILTHHHIDHVKGAGTISRGLHKPAQMPVFMTPGTHRGCPMTMGKVPVRAFKPGGNLCMGGFHIQSIATPHDADESVALILQRGETRLGVFTDLGHVTDEMLEVMPTLDAVILESNYDPEMLANNTRYPISVKRRISGTHGHLSNEESAELIEKHASPRLKAIVLSHLSENSNTPEVAHRSHSTVAARFHAEHTPILRVAPRHTPSEIFSVNGALVAR